MARNPVATRGRGWYRTRMEPVGRRVSPFFVMQCYRDVTDLPRCLRQLRRHYPEARVLVIADGTDDPAIARIGARHGAGVEMGERLFTADKGGAAMHRMLVRFLEGPEPVMLKIDPDTDVFGRLRFEAADFDHPAISGTRQSAGEGDLRVVSIQGGCIVVNRLAAQRLVDSGVLLRPEMGPPEFIWAVNPLILARARDQGLTSHDWTLGYACKVLGISVEPRDEIHSVWRPHLDDYQFSRSGHPVVHPRMYLWTFLPDLARQVVNRALGRE